MIRRLLPLLLLLVLAGCRFERHLLSDPGEDQVVRVESGDRFYFGLSEREREGYRWDCVCEDPDVEVLIDHDDGEAGVRIRILQGYDGPSTARFFYRSAAGGRPLKSFAITLYKFTGDRAFWE